MKCSFILVSLTLLFIDAVNCEQLPIKMLMDNIITNKKSAQPVTSCPSHPFPPEPLPSTIPTNISNAIQAVEKIFSEIVDDITLPGVAIGIQYVGNFHWTKGFGVKDKGSSSMPPDADTIFRIASVTKVFAVITLYQLLEQGKVRSLDDPLTHYCPGFSIRNPYQLDDVVTLRQLASQLSGLPHSAPCYNSSTTDNVCPLTNVEILGRLKNENRVMPSWIKPSYSNLAYSLLGRCLLQSSTGFEEHVEKYILVPLGMTNTGFEFTDSVVSKMATGYIGGGKKAPLINLGWNAPAGQMYSTINDLLKLSEFLNSMYLPYESANNILAPHLVKEMGLPMYLNYDGKSLFGSPWEMMFVDTYLVRTKAGNILGYSSQFSYVPELGLSIVALVNGNKVLEGTIEAAYEAILPAFQSYEAANTAKIPSPPDRDAYIGNYSCIQAPSITANIYAKGDMLLVDLTVTDGTNYYHYTPVLKYYQDLELQVYFDPSQINCLLGELLALNGSWMYFDKPDSRNQSPGFYFAWGPCQMNRTA